MTDTSPVTVEHSTPKATPGPWVVHQRNHASGDLWLDIGYRLPDGTERGPVCDVTGRRYVEPHACDFRSAAEIKYLVTPEQEQWANARLIAAAPDMKDALEGLMSITSATVTWLEDEDSTCSADVPDAGGRNECNHCIVAGMVKAGTDALAKAEAAWQAAEPPSSGGAQ